MRSRLPKIAASTVAPAALMVLCAPGYDGSAAVLASAVQFGSAMVAGCSAVRVVLVFWPRLLISFSGCAYAALVSAGGAPGRNCDPFFKTEGVTLPQVVKTGVGKFGGVGR